MSTAKAVGPVGRILNDSSLSLTERFRALFTLRNIGTKEAIAIISDCFSDQSSLLKHECAYCLGQIQDPAAITVLTRVLEDTKQDPMVRHEAGEALGAIGDTSVCDILQEFGSDGTREVAETCQIALDRIHWLKSEESKGFEDSNPYRSTDPAPSFLVGSVPQWERQLNDTSLPLFIRYRALFALRNRGGRDAVQALASGFKDSSALLKHELAYVLGQMQDKSAVSALKEKLEDLSESAMVRHECAEALGSIASEECLQILQNFLSDSERVVRESCIVALDMYRHESSSDFQYANTVSQISQ